MKSILLASASIVAFTIAGAAAADVDFTGSATLGFNDDDDDVADDHDGFYFDANVAVILSQELDNGITVTAEFDFDAVNVEGEPGADNTSGNGLDLESGGYSITVASETAALIFGDTAFAAETYYSGTGNLDSDGFSEADGEVVLRGEVTFGSFTAGMSYVVADVDGNLVNEDATVDGSVDQLSLGGVGDVGNFSVGFAYQEESDSTGGFYNPTENGDFSTDEIFAIFGSTTFGNADLSLAYASNNTTDEDSVGAGIAYPIGPVVLGFEYGYNSDTDDTYVITVGYASGPITVDASYEDSDDDDGLDDDMEWAIDGIYDVGGGLEVLAGLSDSDSSEDLDYYIAGDLDLGGGARFAVSYAEDDDDSEEDEIGAPEYQEGTTVELTFEF